MNDPVSSSVENQLGAPPQRSWRRFGGKFLFFSVAVHLLFLVAAGYYVVQRYSGPAKKTFIAPGNGPSAPTRALEHKVQMEKQKNAASAPPSAKRATTTGLSKVALPAMPALPSMSASVTPLGLSGTSLSSMSLGGPAGGKGGGGGGGLNFFGLRTNSGLAGTFYDLKQTPARQPSGMTPQKYAQEVSAFLRSNWNSAFFSRYFRGPDTLYASQIFIPDMPATEGPAAFHLEQQVQPSMWLVHYKGVVSPPESGIYHFVGAGDDVLLVRFDNRLVLARNWDNPMFGVIDTHWLPKANYDYGFSQIPKGFAKGDGIEMRGGEFYPMEVLIGEQPGGNGFAALLVEKEGIDYSKDAKGNPILPIFRTSNAPLPPLKPGMNYAPHVEGGPIWKVKPPEKSIFDR